MRGAARQTRTAKWRTSFCCFTPTARCGPRKSESFVGERFLLGSGPTGGAYLVVVIQSRSEIVPKTLTAFVEQRFKRVGVERIYQTDTIEMIDTGKKDRLQTDANSFRLTYRM